MVTTEQLYELRFAATQHFLSRARQANGAREIDVIMHDAFDCGLDIEDELYQEWEQAKSAFIREEQETQSYRFLDFLNIKTFLGR
jgi:hypothetical protein